MNDRDTSRHSTLTYHSVTARASFTGRALSCEHNLSRDLSTKMAFLGTGRVSPGPVTRCVRRLYTPYTPYSTKKNAQGEPLLVRRSPPARVAVCMGARQRCEAECARGGESGVERGARRVQHGVRVAYWHDAVRHVCVARGAAGGAVWRLRALAIARTGLVLCAVVALLRSQAQARDVKRINWGGGRDAVERF